MPNKKNDLDTTKKYLKADLHLHSHMSDGCHEPAKLIRMAVEAGLEIVSLTDHDSVAGTAEARRVAEENGCLFIAGVELEAFVTEDGRNYSVHILGYGIDEKAPRLIRALEKVRTARRRRARQIVEKLQNCGVDISKKEVFSFSKGESVGRVHIAQALVQKNIVEHIDEAFDEYIGDDKPAYVPKKAHNPQQIIRIIHAAGGKAVWAHPYFCKNDSLVEPLVEAGIDGMECHHREFSLKMSEYYLTIARQYKLFTTGGSDYHGTLEEQFSLGDWWFDLPATGKEMHIFS